jgi:serine/threonine protein kinase, bacterial
MGEVCLVKHARLHRRDALKILPADVSADREFRERFNREADLAATLFHLHIVGVHDRGEYDGQLWISMDYIDGTDAAGLMRDRYPPGCLLRSNGDRQHRRERVGDFGIARNVGDISGLAATNMIVGTLPYAAPEQLMDDPIDGRADGAFRKKPN